MVPKLYLQIPPDRQKAADDSQKSAEKKLGDEYQNEISYKIGLDYFHIGGADHVGRYYFHNRKEENAGNDSRENTVNHAFKNKGEADEIIGSPDQAHNFNFRPVVVDCHPDHVESDENRDKGE